MNWPWRPAAVIDRRRAANLTSDSENGADGHLRRRCVSNANGRAKAYREGWFTIFSPGDTWFIVPPCWSDSVPI